MQSLQDPKHFGGIKLVITLMFSEHTFVGGGGWFCKSFRTFSGLSKKQFIKLDDFYFIQMYYKLLFIPELIGLNFISTFLNKNALD